MLIHESLVSASTRPDRGSTCFGRPYEEGPVRQVWFLRGCGRLSADGGERDHHGTFVGHRATLVKIGVDLTKMNTIGDLQGGIEEAERQLGFRVIRTEAS